MTFLIDDFGLWGKPDEGGTAPFPQNPKTKNALTSQRHSPFELAESVRKTVFGSPLQLSSGKWKMR